MLQFLKSGFQVMATKSSRSIGHPTVNELSAAAKTKFLESGENNLTRPKYKFSPKMLLLCFFSMRLIWPECHTLFISCWFHCMWKFWLYIPYEQFSVRHPVTVYLVKFRNYLASSTTHSFSRILVDVLYESLLWSIPLDITSDLVPLVT